MSREPGGQAPRHGVGRRPIDASACAAAKASVCFIQGDVLQLGRGACEQVTDQHQAGFFALDLAGESTSSGRSRPWGLWPIDVMWRRRSLNAASNAITSAWREVSR